MLTAMGDVLRECYKRGWITTRDGNVSLRMSLDGEISEHMYITPKGVRKNIIHPEHIIKINVNGDTKQFDVSTEFHMHRNLLLYATSTRSVVHVHPTNTVAAMFAGIDLQEIAGLFPEIKRYTKVGPTVSFFEAGSTDLASATEDSLLNKFGMLDCDIVGQYNHGVCAVGKHPWDAFEHIERLEHICQMVMIAKSSGKTR